MFCTVPSSFCAPLTLGGRQPGFIQANISGTSPALCFLPPKKYVPHTLKSGFKGVFTLQILISHIFSNAGFVNGSRYKENPSEVSELLEHSGTIQ